MAEEVMGNFGDRPGHVSMSPSNVTDSTPRWLLEKHISDLLIDRANLVRALVEQGAVDEVTITKAQLRRLVKAAVQPTQISDDQCGMCNQELDYGAPHTPDCELPALEELCK